MNDVTRGKAIAQLRRTIVAYQKMVHEVRNDTDRLPLEGARIVDDYCSFGNDHQSLVLQAIRETSFLDGMDDALLLEYCIVCKELDEALGLDSWLIGKVERIVQDENDKYGKVFWETLRQHNGGAAKDSSWEDAKKGDFAAFRIGQKMEKRNITASFKTTSVLVKNETGDFILIKPEDSEEPYILLKNGTSYQDKIDGIIFADGTVYKTNGASKYVAKINENKDYEVDGGEIKDFIGNAIKTALIILKAGLQKIGLDKDNSLMRWEDYYGVYHYGKDKQGFLNSWLGTEKQLINNDKTHKTSFIPFPLKDDGTLPTKQEILIYWSGYMESGENNEE